MDTWRVQQVIHHTAKQGHPFRKFGTGESVCVHMCVCLRVCVRMHYMSVNSVCLDSLTDGWAFQMHPLGLICHQVFRNI